jgi:hypothetical protein
MIDHLRRRGPSRSGPRPHLCRGGDGGFVEIPPSRYEWEQWARKVELEAERAEGFDRPTQPEPQESFHERYWREYDRTDAAGKLDSEPFDKEGRTLPRPRDEAKLEQPRRDPTPEQEAALSRLARRVSRQRKIQSEQARSQKRDARGRFA